MRERVPDLGGSAGTAPATQPPAWSDFEERPADDVELRSPAAELAAILQRYRDDLDDAARAGAQSRAHGLRALAELAVLAVQLDGLLERHAAELDASPAGARSSLGRLKDRMLAHIATSGLEVVRLRGARAGDVADIADVDCWRYDEVHDCPVVVEELEAAVRLDGAVLRRGRVVMGGQPEARVPAAPPPEATRRKGHGPPPVPPPRPATAPPVPRVVCPISGCGAVNHAAAEACIGCLTPLAGFARLSLHPGAIFNDGLRAARAGNSASARECFAAIVLWHPQDVTSANAHALACLDAGDVDAARRAWGEVLDRSPGDPLAQRGLAAIRPAR